MSVLKTIALGLTVLLLTACGPRGLGGLRAGSGEPADGGAVIVVRTARHLDVALMTAAGLLRGNYEGVRYPAAHVIACGDAVPALIDNAAGVSLAADAGVVISACGLTLQRKGIPRASLPSRVSVVENGIVEALRLQRRGFQSVEL